MDVRDCRETATPPGHQTEGAILRRLRVLSQLCFTFSALYLGVGLVSDWTGSSVERYCPFGGLATTYSLFTEQNLSCATGEFNVTLLLALLVLTVLARKVFCSWVCPIGALSEWVGSAAAVLSARVPRLVRRSRATGDDADEPGRRRVPRNRKTHGSGLVNPPRWLDRPLRWLRLPVLALVLGFSFYTAELIFRPFCPYYVTFSMNGHDVELWSYVILGGLLGLVIVIPMGFCRYLCPLGGALWPFSAGGRLRLRRDSSSCTSCRACDRACPHSLPISTSEELRSGECTLCLECTHACRVKAQPLTLHASSRSRSPINQAVIPALLGLAILAGVVGGNLIAIPSYSRTFADTGVVSAEDQRSTTLEVSGVHCVNTARRVSKQVEGVPGVLQVTAFASNHEIVIEYDADAVGVDELVRAIEGPVFDVERNMFFFQVFQVIAIDGRRVP